MLMIPLIACKPEPRPFLDVDRFYDLPFPARGLEASVDVEQLGDTAWIEIGDRTFVARRDVTPASLPAVDPPALLWTGTIDNLGTVTFAGDGKDICGLLHLGDEVYELAPDEDGGSVLVDARRLPPFRDRYSMTESPVHTDAFSPFEPTGPVSRRIRVLVVYTPAAGPSVRPCIRASFADIDASTRNSDVIASLEMATSVQLEHGFDDDGDFDYQLKWLRDDGDGHYDEIFQLRSEAQADVVVLIVAGGALDGEAPIFADADTAFAVIDSRHFVAYATIAHEVGHLVGLRHEDDAADSPIADGHGYVFERDGQELGTIMASGRAQRGRVGRWSNPSAPDHLGIPGWSDEAAALDRYAPRVAQFYETSKH